MKFSFSADSVGCAAGRSSGVVLGGQGLFCYFVFESVPKWPHKYDDTMTMILVLPLKHGIYFVWQLALAMLDGKHSW